ncbi:MAG: FliI/YscN family ATPase [Mangrovicoccus sp.]|nr:FliI/YscN family ATPase [Mangrovicoccus sp.]
MTCSQLEKPVSHIDLSALSADLQSISPMRPIGRIERIRDDRVELSGLTGFAALGDQVTLKGQEGRKLRGEIMRIDPDVVHVIPEGDLDGFTAQAPALLDGPFRITPSEDWIGRILDSAGRPLDGRPMPRGTLSHPIHTLPPPAAERRSLGPRLEAGVAVYNTLLPLVRGQRIGLFAGSGVGKTTLLGNFARHVDADLVVLALVGERGRELRDFAEDVLGADGLARSVIITETSDKSPLERARAALSAMTVAEFFRDQGKHVLLLIDSVSRHAEAYQELRLSLGEPASFRGYPPSLAHRLMALAERAGPGHGSAGDITAVFSVLVQGDDMQEPVADLLRGVLDGHTVLDRKIAERGRFPAVDLLRSVSRSLPRAATQEENSLIQEARALLGSYDRAELMIQSGLYSKGTDPQIDRAIACWPALDAFLAQTEPETIAESFDRLRGILT